jgi:hypothetical protein
MTLFSSHTAFTCSISHTYTCAYHVAVYTCMYDMYDIQYRANGPALEDGGAYDEQPTGTIDMNDIALVDTTRTSESGNKDLRLVDKEGQVCINLSSYYVLHRICT